MQMFADELERLLNERTIALAGISSLFGRVRGSLTGPIHAALLQFQVSRHALCVRGGVEVE